MTSTTTPSAPAPNSGKHTMTSHHHDSRPSRTIAGALRRLVNRLFPPHRAPQPAARTSQTGLPDGAQP